MGATGFEPVTAWSEAKYSVQTELSARIVLFRSVPYKSHDSHRFRQGTTHSPSGCSQPMIIGVGGLCYVVPIATRVMTDTDATVSDEAQARATPLELLSDDEGSWTAVPADASGDERVSKWLEVEGDVLCDLEEWR